MRGDGLLARGCALACGFGFMRAVTSNAYITAFGAASGSSLGFVAKTEFSLLTNLVSVVVAALLVRRSPLRASRSGRWVAMPRALIVGAAAVLVVGYAAGSVGAFARVPELAGEIAVSALYAAGMLVLTLSWFEAFSAERDLRFALRCLLCGYLVQAGVYFALSFLEGWALFGACSALLAVSLALMRHVRRGAEAPPTPSSVPVVRGRGELSVSRCLPLGAVMRALTGSFLCVFTLTAVVGLLHTSVIGNDFEYVVGAIPMTEALAIATVLLALVVFVSRRVPSTSAVYRALFPRHAGRPVGAAVRLGIARRLRRDDHGGLLRPGRHGVRAVFARGGVRLFRPRRVPDGHLSGGRSSRSWWGSRWASGSATRAPGRCLVCDGPHPRLHLPAVNGPDRAAAAAGQGVRRGRRKNRRGRSREAGGDAGLLAAEAAVLGVSEAVGQGADVSEIERRAQRAMRERVGSGSSGMHPNAASPR